MPNSSSTAQFAGGAAARACSSADSSSPGFGPVELSARGLHELAVKAFRIGNRGRLSLCESLRVLSETRLFLELGFPSIAAYADTFFQLRRAEAYEHVRVATVLVELTELREAFGQGKIGWSVLKAVTRVASVDTQTTWIDFASRHGAERTLAEARDALQRRRDKPRDSSFGLPNLDQKLVLRFSRSDMEKVRGWIESACQTVVEKTGTVGVSVEQALLFLCEKGMAPQTPPLGTSDNNNDMGSVSCAPHRAQIVYQRCPDCRRARMGTREGFVEVASEEVERHEGCAEPVVIDGPTTPGSPGRGTPPKMRRQILAREGGRCRNPRCRNRAAHCHHIEWQSDGGKTCLANEVGLCETCHALIHAGLLRLSGEADGDLEFSPVAVGDSLKRSVAADGDVAGVLPVLNLQAKRPNGSPEDRSESANADWPPAPPTEKGGAAAGCGLDLDALTQGLVRLGVPAARSRRIIDAVIQAQPPGALTESGVLRSALAAI